jgi:RNA polymerase sigma factor (sigma-70 family)
MGAAQELLKTAFLQNSGNKARAPPVCLVATQLCVASANSGLAGGNKEVPPTRPITLSEHRLRDRRATISENRTNDRLDIPDDATVQNQAVGATAPNKDERVAFNEVFLPHMAEAFRLAQWLTGNAHDAEDIVQEAAIRAFRGIKSFGAVNARAWSLSIVRNTAFSWLTKNRPKAVVFTDDLSPEEQQQLEHENAFAPKIETPEQIALLKADTEQVRQALAELPPPFREVIVLREINQLNYRDIAEITNVPIGTVMSRLSRGRQHLIALLGGDKQ